MKVEFKGSREEIVNQIFEFLKHADFTNRVIEFPLGIMKSEGVYSKSFTKIVKVAYCPDSDYPHVYIKFKETDWVLRVQLEDDGSPELSIYENEIENGDYDSLEVTIAEHSSLGLHEIQIKEIKDE